MTDGRRRPGLLTGTLGPITMGMRLSLPMVAFGAWLIWRAEGRPVK